MSIFNICMGVLVIGCTAVVGSMDYEDALSDQEHYCRNVAEGIWPDYKESFQTECKEQK